MGPEKNIEPLQVSPGSGQAKPPDKTGAGKGAPPPTREQADFRDEVVEQVLAMSRFLLANDSKDAVGENATKALGALDRDEPLTMESLIAAHNELKGLVAPAAPGALAARSGRQNQKRFGRFLGPNSVMRNLAATNLFFLAAFLGISLSPLINENTIKLSIYEQSGYPLLLKLCFLICAAGLGASFGALFDLWDEIKTNRFDPSGESVHWMKISLGIVAGISLTEIFQTSAPVPEGELAGTALIALVGGFSAGLLHVALSRMVNAIKSIFAPADGK